jgi:hypothetical protein
MCSLSRNLLETAATKCMVKATRKAVMESDRSTGITVATDGSLGSINTGNFLTN